MSNERDDLAAIIASPESVDGGPVSCGPNAVYAARTADAILAAGYRKPRTVSSVEELDGLPNGTLLLASDRYPSYAGSVWRVKSGGMIERVGLELKGVTPLRYFKDPLPATVLHEPEADGPFTGFPPTPLRKKKVG
jgi:hypothetical protein